jgi:hypothetical protein
MVKYFHHVLIRSEAIHPEWHSGCIQYSSFQVIQDKKGLYLRIFPGIVKGKGCVKMRRSILALGIAVLIIGAMILPVVAAPVPITLSDILAAVRNIQTDVTTIKQWTTTAGGTLGGVGTQLTSILSAIGALQTDVSWIRTATNLMAGNVILVNQKADTIQGDTGTIRTGISNLQTAVSKIPVNKEPTGYMWYLAFGGKSSYPAHVYVMNNNYEHTGQMEEVTVEFLQADMNDVFTGHCIGTDQVKNRAEFICQLGSGNLNTFIITTHSKDVVPIGAGFEDGDFIPSTGDWVVYPVYS